MNQMQKALEDLVAEIKNSEEYQRYTKAKNEICKNPALKVRADELRKQNYDLQCTGTAVLAEAEHLWNEYQREIQNPIIGEYLTAETGFCRCIQEINWMLMEELDFDAEFLFEEEGI